MTPPRALARAAIIGLLAACAASCQPREALVVVARPANANLSPVAAMLRVHESTLSQMELPSAVTAMLPPLADSLVTIRDDQSALGWSRRRRAVGALMAAGWMDRRFDEQVRLLGADPSAIRDAVGRAYTNPLPFQFDDRDDVERAVVNLPDSALFPAAAPRTRRCWTKTDGNFVQWKENKRTLVIGSAVSIDENAWSWADVKQSLDPQSWDDCSGFWPDGGTYLTERNAPPWGMPPPPMNQPPPVGDPWWGLFLFERFECVRPGCDARFSNVLGTTVASITEPPGAGGTVKHAVYYWLAKDGALDGDVGGMPARLVIDEGWVKAFQTSGNAIQVNGHKEVEFDSASVTQWAYAALLNYEKAALLGELACCLNQRDP